MVSSHPAYGINPRNSLLLGVILFEQQAEDA